MDREDDIRREEFVPEHEVTFNEEDYLTDDYRVDPGEEVPGDTYELFGRAGQGEEKQIRMPDSVRKLQKKLRRQRSYLRFFLRSLAAILLVLLLIGIVAGTVFTVWFYKNYYREYDARAREIVEGGSRADFRLNQSSIIYDRDGNVIIRLRSGGDSSYLSYADIPQDAVNAFIAVEDRTFWTNPGYDLKGIIRVLYYYVKTHGVEAHGASTVTQQLARNVYLSREVTISRKLMEILVSGYLTKKYSKEDIMEFYINDIYFANQYYGLEAAAEGYFGKHASELTLSQIAYLCSIPNRPSYYDPVKEPKNALTRRNKILGDMLEMNFITKKQYEEAVAESITVKERKSAQIHDYQATYAIDCAVRYLMQTDGFVFRSVFSDKNDYRNYQALFEDQYEDEKDRLYTAGLRIRTSLDSVLQERIQEALDTELSFDQEKNEDTGAYALQGAAACVDNETGRVVAVVGGRSISGNNTYTLNRAYQSYRQPGSSIKPLVVYAPALENGYYPGTVVQNIDVTKAKEKGANALTMTGDAMTLREAVEQSKNGVAWQILANIGPKEGLKHITWMQYARIVPEDYNLAASLGGLTYGVSVTEQAAGYAALADHGVYRGRTCITSIRDTEGNELFSEDTPKQVYEQAAADTMIDIMKGVLTRGTAVKMNWYESSGIEAAGKTGTTNGSKDGWFCGVTPYYSIAVWVGYDEPRELSSLYGSSYPAAIWKASMLAATEGLPDAAFSLPDLLEELPAGAEKYLPGRDDSEVLYEGYTVGDYRADHTMGDNISLLLLKMQNLDVYSPAYNTELSACYQQCIAAISTIRDQAYAAQLLNDTNTVYALGAARKPAPALPAFPGFPAFP